MFGGKTKRRKYQNSVFSQMALLHIKNANMNFHMQSDY